MNKCKSYSVSAFRSLCVCPFEGGQLELEEKKIVNEDYVMMNRKQITCNYSRKISSFSFSFISIGCQMYKNDGQ